MAIKKNLVLLGMMGVGKSTIGKYVAKKLKINFFDIDGLIEKNNNMKIAQIFGQKGEKYFRNCLLDYSPANNVAGWQWGAGCGAVWGGVVGVVPGVGSGDVAHGALILEISSEMRAPSGCSGVYHRYTGRVGLVWARGFRVPVVRGLSPCSHIYASF